MFSSLLTENPCFLADKKNQNKPEKTSLVKHIVAVNENGRRIGQTHHRAKATDKEIDLIRELHEEHRWGYGRLSKKFNLSKRTIRDICSYKKRAQFISNFKTIFVKEPVSEEK